MKRLDTISYVILLATSLLVIAGGWLMATTGRDIVLGIVAATWAQTTGRMVEVQGEDSNSAEGGYSWVAHVRYTYTVKGHQYEGTIIHPTYGNPPSHSVDHRLAALLESAREVRVFYDESQPIRSTLAAGFYSSSLTVLFVGFMFFAAGLGMSSIVMMAFSSSTGMLLKRISMFSLCGVVVGFALTIGFLVAGGNDVAGGISVIR